MINRLLCTIALVCVGATALAAPPLLPRSINDTDRVPVVNTGTSTAYTVSADQLADYAVKTKFSNHSTLVKLGTGPTGPTFNGQSVVGQQGPQGQQGPSGTVSIGTTTTGAAGTNAAITNSGTSSNAVLNFTIPRGATGAQGPQGATGPQGIQGQQGPQGAQGVQGPQGAAGGSTNWRGAYDNATEYSNNDAVSYLGSSYIALTDVIGIIPTNTLYWNLLALKGDTGSQGPQGATGPQGTAGTTGAQGPQGIQGIQGPTGPTGPQGATGAAGGTVAFKGAWSSATNYVALDVVTYNGSSYVAKASSQNVSPTVTASWQLMAQKGADGSQGVQGVQGPTGPTGPQGAAGATGPQGDTGPQGNDGPNVVSTSTSTAINGMMKGNGSAVQQAVANTDYLPVANPVVTGGITTPAIIPSSPDGTWRFNVRNSVSRTYTPQEGDMDTDAAGRMWLYISGQWVEKGAPYTLPTASPSTLGGVKTGNTLTIANGVLDVMLNSLGSSGLVTAGLSGDATIRKGFAYVAASSGTWTFANYSSGTTTLFSNYSGTVCGATSGGLNIQNPITFANRTSSCAKVYAGTYATIQSKGDGKYWVTSNRNLTKQAGAASGTGGGGGVSGSYSDSFDGTNGAQIAAAWHSLPAPYTTTAATIQGNLAQVSSWGQAGGYYAASNADTSQIVLKGADSAATPTKRLCVRAGAGTLGYSAAFGYGGGTLTSANIYKNGSYLSTISFSSVNTTADITAKLVASGTSTVTLSLYLNGSLAGTATDSTSPLSTGSPGWYVDGGSSAAYNQVDTWQDH